jgi:hypothetical protein
MLRDVITHYENCIFLFIHWYICLYEMLCQLRKRIVMHWNIPTAWEQQIMCKTCWMLTADAYWTFSNNNKVGSMQIPNNGYIINQNCFWHLPTSSHCSITSIWLGSKVRLLRLIKDVILLLSSWQGQKLWMFFPWVTHGIFNEWCFCPQKLSLGM